MPKRLRYADRLLVSDPDARLADVHLLIGGTGAVGGATLMKMLRIYEDLRRIHGIGKDVAGPVIVATGHDDEMLTRFKEYIDDVGIGETKATETQTGDILRMRTGGLIVLHKHNFAVLPKLIASVKAGEPLKEALNSYIARSPEDDSLLDVLRAEARADRSFTDLLDSVRAEIIPRMKFTKYRSVQIGIPLPTLLEYHVDVLERLQKEGHLNPDEVETVKNEVTAQLVEQLKEVRSNSVHVLVAHTTAVGGMYDTDVDGKSRIRLGFSHAAKDHRIEGKRRQAESLSKHYAKAGIWNLVTAAAIGIDHVAIDRPLDLQSEMAKGLREATIEPFPEARKAKYVHIHRPESLRILSGPASNTPLMFERLAENFELKPRFALRSGENGYLSVANAEALYRVMRVASPSELGAVMALVGALGDEEDSLQQWFPKSDAGRECYYTETDNSRLVFDFLSQPQLRAMQLSGLEPQALVQLGSSKHQAELHTLGLLILLHRLRTLDLDAVPAAVRSDRFDVDAFFEQNSRPLTFEDVQQWDVEKLEEDLKTLVLAESPAGLFGLKDFRTTNQKALSQHRIKVRDMILQRVIQAVWSVTSLGSPLIVAGDDGNPLVRVGWWVAPIPIVAEREGSLAGWFATRIAELGEKGWMWDLPQLTQHHFAVNGFVDLRAHAIVASSKTDEGPSTVRVARNEEELEAVLAELVPYQFFATCGLLAVHYRLKRLGDYIQAAQSQIQLGTHHDVAWAIPRDHREHTLVVPGIVEALRMVSEGLEKATGTELLSGNWGYRWGQ